MTELSTRTLNRTLLKRQMLLRRAALSPEQAVEHLVGMQAQAPNPPYLGLFARLSEFDPEDLSELVSNRRVVRIALQRNTIHLVSASDAILLRRVLKPVIDSGLRHNYGAQLRDVDLPALATRGRELVESEPLTFARLGELLAEEFPQAEPNALAQGVRQLVPLVQVPPRGLWGQGGAATHTSLESWLSSGGGAPSGESPDELDAVVLRYLAAFGPASVRDMQMWCGLTRLSAVVKRLGDRLSRYMDENGTVLYDSAEAPLADEDLQPPVRLLPDYDNILLSHADRTRILDAEYRAAIFTANGRILASVLVDGFVAATWRYDAGRLTVSPLRTLKPTEKREVESEAERTLGLLAPEGEARVAFAP
ncbi:winged helix DNA-binding domain-containing protein [Actinospica robiniae]|uniref:winged helix DNA-binding domain-containing protein n=1 Tax=Actinospica robiniae TaxID=304901 RepID=UPI00040658EC|nr:winged helix DNA-binding domain-containing protein [Actinospica robiniae]